ncbi:hypothetical protein BCV69DRAFT_280789 [Microstroma glucosiphilum]|uniref:Nicotinamide N-methyltransferase n=1 Tax=Pseudomicrostroma glucosiphilum TaxID=1684307 RepID=A0A316UE48_9BASI|nr:hypothetical protein BCV69DRAFT_280789 [Pseudomicrostroma glucosiphilum]PWN23178.1 hypothetical protein BCV69DRAFT_280789 [Pseudomicrostroma glucosiphilum]
MTIVEAVASAQVEITAPRTTQRAFHPSLGLPEDRLVYRPCPLFPSAEHCQPANGVEAAGHQQHDFSVRIPPASVPLIFAHRQWRSGLILADLLAAAAVEASPSASSPWNVQGLTVLELGCGTGIPGMVAHRLGGASSTLVTDYDAPPLIETLRFNVASNFEPAEIKTGIRAVGFSWGTNTEDLEDTMDTIRREKKRAGVARGVESQASSSGGRFDRILLADCVWDSLSHEVLLKSVSQLLAKPARAQETGKGGETHSTPLVLLVSGFHTGRETLLSFIRRAHRFGLVLQEAPGSSSLLPALPAEEELVVKQEQARLGEASSASAYPLWNAPRFVCELELAAEDEEEAEAGVAAGDTGAPTTTTTTVIDAGRAPRLTGRRRAFVLEEREEEKKENGGVLIRNRWMTVFALGWA